MILDILRASSTMTYALNSGAEAIIPCQEIDEARELAGPPPANRRRDNSVH